MPKIYLIKCELDGVTTYKIGKTNRNVQNRLDELSTGNPGKLSIIFEFETQYNSLLEIALHNHYNSNRINKEWFNDKINISQFKDTCKMYDDNIKKLKDMDNFFI